MARHDVQDFIDKLHAGGVGINRVISRKTAKFLQGPYQVSDDDAWALVVALDTRIPALNITDLKVLYAPISRNYPTVRRFFLEAVARGKRSPLENSFAKIVQVDPSEESYRDCQEVLFREGGQQAIEKMDELLAETALKNALLYKNSALLDELLKKDQWQSMEAPISKGHGKKNDKKFGWVAAWAALSDPEIDNFDSTQLSVLDCLLKGGAEINSTSPRGTASHALEIMCERIEGWGRLTTEYRKLKKGIEALLDRGARWDNIWSNAFAIEIIRNHPAYIRDELTQVANKNITEGRAVDKPKPTM